MGISKNQQIVVGIVIILAILGISRRFQTDYLDETPSEEVLDEMRGLGMTYSDN